MILYQSVGLAYEMRLLHARMLDVFRWVVESGAWERHTGSQALIVTDIWRNRAETVAIYTAAGKEPPAISVHELAKINGDPFTGVRGIDLSIRQPQLDRDYSFWPRLASTKVRAFVEAVNQTWRYHPEDRYQVALFHSVSGPHVHLQVAQGDTTVKR